MEVLRRLLPRRRRDQYQFELLKSCSAHEFQPRCRQGQSLPRYFSHHERLATPESFSRTITSKRSEEAIDYVGEGPAHPDRSTFLGFVSNQDDVLCQGNTVFEHEDLTYEKAISEFHRIRESPSFSEGILLKCVESKPLFPFLHICQFVDPDSYQRRREVDDVIRDCNASRGSLYGGYEEVYSIQKSSTATETRLPTSRHAGFITIGFKLLDDFNNQSHLEKTWLNWTGAREIYKYAPIKWNLRRISLLRYIGRTPSASRPFAYLLLCEFGSILHPGNTVQALDMCERLRVRNCGHIALFQVHTVYTPLARTSGRARPQESGTPKRNPMMRGFSQDVDCHTEPRRSRLRARQKSLQYTDEQYHQMHRNSPV